jgi:mono/diheme cytochrome c family protein
VRTRSLLKFIALSFGIALLLAGLFFKGGQAGSAGLQTTPAPTQDRLAEPTMPPSPSQADRGAQVYWLSCLPCHGDRGQGLTNEFRAVYPPEDQNCWKSGCHGERPYESGFTIPKVIPALIGAQAISNFSDAAQLNAYIRAAMPYWKPGSLTDQDAWLVTAFLMRQNGLWNGVGELNASNAGGIKILRGTPTPLASPGQDQVQKGSQAGLWLTVIGALVAFLMILFFTLKKIKKKATI